MKQTKLPAITLEDTISEYISEANGRKIVFKVKEGEQLNLIRLGFRGDEIMLRVIKNVAKQEVEYRKWYANETTDSWQVGASQTLVTANEEDQAEQMKQLAEKATGKSFNPYSAR